MSDPSHDLYEQAKAAISEKNWSIAELLLTKCLSDFGENARPVWYFYLVNVKRRLDKYDDADLICLGAIAKFPKHAQGYVCQAENALLNQKWKLACRLWRELIEKFSETVNPIWRVNLCFCLYKSESSEVSGVAAKIFEDFSEFKSVTPNLYANVAIKMAQIEQLSIARLLCAQSYQLFPASAEVFRAIAFVSQRQQLNLKAAKAWRTAAELSSGGVSIEYAYSEILCLIRAGRYLAAKEKIHTLQGIAPDHEKFWMVKLEYFQALGEMHDAFKVMQIIATRGNLLKLIPLATIASICKEADLTVEQAKAFVCADECRTDLLAQLENLYGQLSPGDEKVFEILENKNELWFEDQQERNLKLRLLKRNFLKDRRIGNFTHLVKYWLTFSNPAELRYLCLLATRLFPNSLLKYRLDLISGKNSDFTAILQEPWRRFLPCHADSINSQLDQVPYKKLYCIVVVKDESEMLPHFLAHYRKIGVRSFIIIDNDPDCDMTIEDDLRDGLDIIMIKAPFGFAKNNHGMNWINEFLNAQKCEWLLFVDIDEFFIYPRYEEINIYAFIDQLAAVHQTAVSAFMLDMYDLQYLEQSIPGPNIEEHLYFYDEYYFVTDLFPPYRFITGGVRGSGRWSNMLNKVPLIKASEEIRYIGNHSVSHCAIGKNTAVLLHYKLYRDRDLFQLTAKGISNHKRISDRSAGCIARHIDIYRRDQLQDFFNKTKKYVSSNQLVELGYLSSSD